MGDIPAREAQDMVWRTEIENSDLGALVEKLRMEARLNAMEARTAVATVREMYQVLSGAKGEPGDWNGAEPARRVMAALASSRAALEKYGEHNVDCGIETRTDEEVLAGKDVPCSCGFDAALASAGADGRDGGGGVSAASEPDLPTVTHSSVIEVFGCVVTVHQLSNGQRVLEDNESLRALLQHLGVELPTPIAPPSEPAP